MSDIQKAFPHLDPNLLGHDIAFPAMLRFLPAGWMGLMLGGLIAANSSTILTHLNWGASYLVHDFYRRFVQPGVPERITCGPAGVATVILFVLSSATVFALDTAKDSFNIILQIGAGTGLLYLVRWFWWRVTAWCEIVAMVSSFGISMVFLILARVGAAPGTAAATADHRDLHDGVLAGGGVSGAANRHRDAHLISIARCARRARVEARCHRGGDTAGRNRSRHARPPISRSRCSGGPRDAP